MAHSAVSHGPVGHDGDTFYRLNMAFHAVFCWSGGLMVFWYPKVWCGAHEWVAQATDHANPDQGHKPVKISCSVRFFRHNNSAYTRWNVLVRSRALNIEQNFIRPSMTIVSYVRRCSAAIASISTFAPLGKAATCTQARAGLVSLKNFSYTWFILEKSPRSVR